MVTEPECDPWLSREVICVGCTDFCMFPPERTRSTGTVHTHSVSHYTRGSPLLAQPSEGILGTSGGGVSSRSLWVGGRAHREQGFPASLLTRQDSGQPLLHECRLTLTLRPLPCLYRLSPASLWDARKDWVPLGEEGALSHFSSCCASQRCCRPAVRSFVGTLQGACFCQWRKVCMLRMTGWSQHSVCVCVCVCVQSQTPDIRWLAEEAPVPAPVSC